MPVTLRREVVADIIRVALSGDDHRDIVIDLLDGAFVSYVIEFFEKIVYAKVRKRTITRDWYRDHFLDQRLDKSQFAWNGGLNMKTIKNKHKSERRQIVIDEALGHYDKFLKLVDSLSDDRLNIDLSITFRDVTVHLDMNESLVVINALAVRRAAFRGGFWSTVGKQVEGPLMETLCRVYDVDKKYFTKALAEDNSLREVDYHLLSPDGSKAKCEVKLMGVGNPESADAIHARDTDVFVASTLSETNRIQLDEAGVFWTELQVSKGFLRFQDTLANLGIPYAELDNGSDHANRIERAIRQVLLL
ncbi:MAG: CfrBI family restriction endonuclease [Dehalococcoidia bacterium]|nr:CfrBI family restriction endonuclease [Dehalococcoidia bacterium]